jgi:hypothetical protein
MTFSILVFSGICVGMILLGLRTPKKLARSSFKRRAA